MMGDPRAFRMRCRDLERRGVLPTLADELYWVGDVALVSEVERASAEDIAALNDEWMRRKSQPVV